MDLLNFELVKVKEIIRIEKDDNDTMPKSTSASEVLVFS